MKWLVTVLLLATAAEAGAQQACPPARANTRADSARADITLFARVHADELRFETRPDARITAAGCPAVDTSHVTVRTNLPRPAEPGVTYRNVTVDFRLRLFLSDFDCYLADLLGAAGADSAQIRGAARACERGDTIRSR